VVLWIEISTEHGIVLPDNHYHSIYLNRAATTEAADVRG